MDEARGRELTRSMHRSSGSFELAFSPLLLGLLGFLVDRWLGTVPFVTVAVVVLGFAGVVVKLYYGYESEMREHEAGKPWARRR